MQRNRPSDWFEIPRARALGFDSRHMLTFLPAPLYLSLSFFPQQRHRLVITLLQLSSWIPHLHQPPIATTTLFEWPFVDYPTSYLPRIWLTLVRHFRLPSCERRIVATTTFLQIPPSWRGLKDSSILLCDLCSGQSGSCTEATSSSRHNWADIATPLDTLILRHTDRSGKDTRTDGLNCGYWKACVRKAIFKVETQT